MTLHVFVGYDTREHAAWLVCRHSLLRTGGDVAVHPLVHRTLRRQGLFTRPWRIAENGQMWDLLDGRPFSTEFSHTRFLVPHLARQKGLKGSCVFVDCDFMFLASLHPLMDGLNPDLPMSVVKHSFTSRADGKKMDGVLQQAYPRKLWSSLIVFNLDHPGLDRFSPDAVNARTGTELHNFLGMGDDEIGDLDEAWNFIPGHSRPDLMPKAVHWSFGGPWFPDFADTFMADQWRQTLADSMTEAVNGQPQSLFEVE